MKRLLAIDVGNTHTTLGLFDGPTLLDSWRIATRVSRTADEIWTIYSQLLGTSGHALKDIGTVSISSVVPEQTASQAAMASARLKINPLIITDQNVKLLRVEYDPPSSVGSDRLCGAAAAFAKIKGSVIIVDLGTATVFDIVTKDAEYLGGLIAPGLMTAVESLHRAAALLPRVDLHYPAQVIGKTTETSIQAGVLFGGVEMVDGLITRIQEQLGYEASVVATGGFARLIAKRSQKIQHVEPDLVLQGIRLITENQ